MRINELIAVSLAGAVSTLLGCISDDTSPSVATINFADHDGGAGARLTASTSSIRSDRMVLNELAPAVLPNFLDGGSGGGPVGGPGGGSGGCASRAVLNDFNGDGKADVMAFYDYGNGSAGLFVFPGTTTDRASEAYRVWFTGPGTFDVNRIKVAIGDFNGDGKADVMAFYDYGDASAGLFVFPGTAETGDRASLPYPVWFTGRGNFAVNNMKMAAGDFNGDGLSDVMTFYDYGDASSTLIVFPGTTRVGVGASAPYAAWSTAPGGFDVKRIKMVAGDFDGDCKADVMTFYDYGGASSALFVFPGTTADRASVVYRTWFTGPGNFDVKSIKMVAGDFNGDGRADVMTFYDYSSASAALIVFPGTPRDRETAPYSTWFTGPGNYNINSTKVAAGDFNGDGKADVMAFYDYSNASATLIVFPGEPTSSSSAPYSVWSTGPGNFDVNSTEVP